MRSASCALAGLALLAAGCTSGSGHRAAAPSPSRTSASPVPSVTDSPVIDPGSQAVDSLTGSARITVSGGSTPPTTVSTSSDAPAQVSVDTSGHVRVDITMRAGDGSLFSLSGPAAGGAVAGDHVAVLLPAAGVLVDTSQGNTCTVTYTRAGETGVAGTAVCDAANGPQRYSVDVAFTLH